MTPIEQSRLPWFITSDVPSQEILTRVNDILLLMKGNADDPDHDWDPQFDRNVPPERSACRLEVTYSHNDDHTYRCQIIIDQNLIDKDIPVFEKEEDICEQITFVLEKISKASYIIDPSYDLDRKESTLWCLELLGDKAPSPGEKISLEIRAHTPLGTGSILIYHDGQVLYESPLKTGYSTDTIAIEVQTFKDPFDGHTTYTTSIYAMEARTTLAIPSPVVRLRLEAERTHHQNKNKNHSDDTA